MSRSIRSVALLSILTVAACKGDGGKASAGETSGGGGGGKPGAAAGTAGATAAAAIAAPTAPSDGPCWFLGPADIKELLGKTVTADARDPKSSVCGSFQGDGFTGSISFRRTDWKAVERVAPTMYKAHHALTGPGVGDHALVGYIKGDGPDVDVSIHRDRWLLTVSLPSGSVEDATRLAQRAFARLDAPCWLLSAKEITDVVGVPVAGKLHGNPQSCAMYDGTGDGFLNVTVSFESGGFDSFVSAASPEFYPTRVDVPGLGDRAVLFAGKNDGVLYLIVQKGYWVVPIGTGGVTRDQLRSLAEKAIAKL